jgi:hypothetical protein
MSSPTAAATNLSPAMRAAAQTAQWKEALRQALCDLRVAIPGIIVSFDPIHQTAVVQVALREKIWAPHAGTIDVAIAQLQDVPIVIPRGGGCSLTMPVQPGNECLLVFADMCIDTWWANGGLQNQFEKRRHDLSDAFFIPGPWNQHRLISDWSTDSAQLRTDDGSAYVDVASEIVTVSGASQVAIEAPAVNISDGSGIPQTLMTDTFYQWWIANIYPFLQSKGYVGPPPPATGSETTVLKGQ